MTRYQRVVLAAAALTLGIGLRPADAQQATLRVPASVLQRYVGEYVYADGNTVKVTVSGDTLFREIPGQRVAFVPLSETVFRMGPVFTAEFVIDPNGGVTKVITDGVEIEHRLPRKGSPASAASSPKLASAPPVRVPRSVLERYAGVYEFIPGQMKRTDLRVIVQLRGDMLVRKMGPNENLLTPVSQTRFRVGNTQLMTEFVVDDAGVTQVMGTGFQQLLTRQTSKH
jgi:hypothetical protein